LELPENKHDKYSINMVDMVILVPSSQWFQNQLVELEQQGKDGLRAYEHLDCPKRSVRLKS